MHFCGTKIDLVDFDALLSYYSNWIYWIYMKDDAYI